MVHVVKSIFIAVTCSNKADFVDINNWYYLSYSCLRCSLQTWQDFLFCVCVTSDCCSSEFYPLSECTSPVGAGAAVFGGDWLIWAGWPDWQREQPRKQHHGKPLASYLIAVSVSGEWIHTIGQCHIVELIQWSKVKFVKIRCTKFSYSELSWFGSGLPLISTYLVHLHCFSSSKLRHCWKAIMLSMLLHYSQTRLLIWNLGLPGPAP